MKISDMEKRLAEEFPDIHVCFSIEVSHHSPMFGRPGTVETEITLFSAGIPGFIVGASFDDCVDQLKRKLTPARIAGDETVEFS